MSTRSGWHTVTFGELVTNVNDYFDRDNGPESRVIAGSNISELGLDITTWGLTTDHDFRPTFKRCFRASDVLFHSRNTEKLAVPDFDGVTGEKIFVLRSKDERRLLQTFLPWLMLAPATRAYVSRSLTGSVNKFLNWTPLARFEFDLPPIDEQREIVSLLRAVVHAEVRIVELGRSLEQAVAAARDELLSRHAKPMVELQEISPIPSQNGLTKVKKSRSGAARMVNMGQIFGREEVEIEGAESVDLALSERKSHLLEEGDLLFARRSIVLAGAGKCSIVPPTVGDVTFESSIIRVRIDRTQAEPRFVLHYFRSRWGRAALRTIARPGPVAGIAGSDLRKLRVPVPELDEQRRIVHRIEAMRAPQSAVALHAGATRKLRAGLIAQLLGAG